jgi:D-serine deaminase-like pyridoxal phosphate-dependent protein
MVANGIDDIHITSEIADPNKIKRALKIATRAKLSVVVDNEIHISLLDAAARAAGVKLDLLIEVDVGQGRCGVAPGKDAVELATRIANTRHLRFRGLQGFHGKLQMTVNLAERQEAVSRALNLLQESAEHIRAEGLPVEILTGGGTGSLVADISLGILNELQPGSYVFMDSQYRNIEWPGAKAVPFDNSLTILGTVISRPSKASAIIDVGLKAASMDHGPPQLIDFPNATFSFGGDEHGQLLFSSGSCPLVIGDKVRLLPSHGDTTANLHDSFVVIRSDHLEDRWKIDARGYSA